ncbi:hypothetical protein AB5J62_03885 [Amycolatopsis sp. cg5]|uniref:hypothetical protein n=1 Tax=Amycolatopsis sp. cg5 TaxID=3238802 RepID=UPI003523C683
MYSQTYGYQPPRGPVAGATTGLGKVTVSVLLSFDGELVAVWHGGGDRPDPLASLLKGLFVSGLDTGAPVVRGGTGTRFRQTGLDFRPPDTKVSIGRCAVDSSAHGLELNGVLGYRLEVTANWNGRVQRENPVSAEQWAAFFGDPLASLGGLVMGRFQAELMSR